MGYWMPTALILASGQGSNAEAIITASIQGKTGFTVLALASDKPQALALKRAQDLGVSTHTFNSKDPAELGSLIEQLQPDWCLLAGYMRIIPPSILLKFKKLNASAREGAYQVLNVHPSLLPKYPGLKGYQRAFENKDPEAGVTIHYVDEGLDTGPILLQEAFTIEAGDDLARVIQKGQSIEHRLYIRALQIVSGLKE